MLDKIIGKLFGKDAADAPPGGADEAGTFGKIAGSLFGSGGVGNGLKGMMEKFTGRGLGDVFKSWVGTGENRPVTEDQVGEVFGEGTLTEVSQKLDLPVDAVKQKLAAHLPGLVDRLTPNGRIEQD